MTEEILLEGKVHISAAKAAREYDFTRDYVARLCREGKVQGKKISKTWYIHESSLKDFLIMQEYHRAIRTDALKGHRSKEYSHANSHRMAQKQEKSDLQIIPEPLTEKFAQHGKLISDLTSDFSSHAGLTDAAVRITTQGAIHVPVYTLTPFIEFLHRLIALVAAVCITFGSYSIIDKQFAARVAYGTRALSDMVQKPLAITGILEGNMQKRAQGPVFAAVGELFKEKKLQGQFSDQLEASKIATGSGFRIYRDSTQENEQDSISAHEAHFESLCLGAAGRKDFCLTASQLTRLFEQK